MSEIRLLQASTEHDWAAVVQFIQQNFAYMDGVIDPPSSVHRLTAETLARHSGEIWLLEQQKILIGTMMLTPIVDGLYLGKLAIADSHRGQGLARRLLCHAEHRCRVLGYSALELEVRVELSDNQRAFAAMGFKKIAESAHEGYCRATSIRLQKVIE